jgi:hypothetical protein
MNKEEYYLLYQDPKWVKCRSKILKRDKQCCTKCKVKTVLQVHHLYYIRNHNPWDYSPHCLITLCRDCHKEWHDKYQIMMFEDGSEINTKRKFKPQFKWWSTTHPKIEKRQKIYVPTKSKKKKNKGFKVHDRLKDARKLY